jgi:uncharacterized membrane protein (DUF485 family)
MQTPRPRDEETPGPVAAATPAPDLDWAAIDADPQFQELHRSKSRFLWGLMVFAIFYYFLLPVGAAYFTDVFRIKVWGPVNFGLLFALSEFAVAWLIAWVYQRFASRRFDPIAGAVCTRVAARGRAR